MKRTTIENLLLNADAAFDSPDSPPADLAGRVIRRSAQRRVANIAISLTVTVAVIGVAITFLYNAQAGPAQDQGKTAGTLASADATTAVTTDADRVAAEVRVHQLVIDRLLVSQRKRRGLAKTKALKAKVDPIVRLDRDVEQAAFVIVAQADRKVRRWNLTDSAASDYQRVIELFPRTHWAEVARQRLARIKSQSIKEIRNDTLKTAFRGFPRRSACLLRLDPCRNSTRAGRT